MVDTDLRGRGWFRRMLGPALALLAAVAGCAGHEEVRTGQHPVLSFEARGSCGDVYRRLLDRSRTCYEGGSFSQPGLEVRGTWFAPRDAGRISVRSARTSFDFLTADVVCRPAEGARVVVSSVADDDWRERTATFGAWARGEEAPCR